MSNQTSIRVRELALESERWKTLSGTLKELCQQNHITFLDRPLHITDRSHDKILVAKLFDLFTHDYFMLLSDSAASLGKKIYFLVDSWIDQSLFQHPSARVFSDPRLFALTALTDPAPEPLNEFKLYNAFIHRAEPVRQSWFYFLWLRGLLDRGYVSYHLYQFDTKLTGQDLFDHIHHRTLDQMESFNQAYCALRPLVPYHNFADSDDLGSVISQTKYSLVLDTYAPVDDVGSFYISEKVTRALQYPTCNLLFVQRDTLYRLHRAGLIIPPQMLEIDTLPWIQRQQRLLDILEHDQIDTSAQDRFQQCVHNRSIMATWLQQVMAPEFCTSIIDEIVSD